jgi:biopolymer transport protein ExbB/TolQ
MSGLAYETARYYADSANSTTVLSVIGGLIASLIAVAGVVGTWAALRVGRNAQVLSTYKASAESWESLANSLKAEKESVEAQLDKALATVRALEARNAALQDLVTGQPVIEMVSRDMKTGFDKLTEQMARIEETLKGSTHGESDPD